MWRLSCGEKFVFQVTEASRALCECWKPVLERDQQSLLSRFQMLKEKEKKDSEFMKKLKRKRDSGDWGKY